MITAPVPELVLFSFLLMAAGGILGWNIQEYRVDRYSAAFQDAIEAMFVAKMNMERMSEKIKKLTPSRGERGRFCKKS